MARVKKLVWKGSIALLVACGAAAVACKDEPEEAAPDDSDGVDIPVRTPSMMAPPEGEMPMPPGPSDEGDAPSRPPVVIPPDRSQANGTSPRGGSCSMNADCVPGLTCFTTIGQSTAGIESVAGGYCSTVCADNDDCASVGATSFCRKGIYGIPNGFCTLPCTVGAPEAEKCNGRSDLVCYANAGEIGTCNPTCGSNDQCGDAFCGFGTNQCRSTPLPRVGRQQVGDACPAGADVTCNGFCVGEPAQAGICTGPCRLGSECGNDPALRCVPSDPALRRGDFGFCERGCSTSADCTPGVAVCAPTGFRTAEGEPEQTCSYALSVPSILNQRLSVEELALPTTPAGLLAVSGFSAGNTAFRLSGGESGVCITGSLASDGPAVLVFQFGSNDGVPFDASAFEGFAIEHSSTHGVLFEAQLSNQPGVLFRNEVAEGLEFPIATGASSVPFAQMAPFDGDEAPWNPAQLEAVRLVVGAGGAPGPFEACVQTLGFE